MKILSYILPCIVILLAFITKRKIVNEQNGEKFAKRELIIDMTRVGTLIVIAVLANKLMGKDVSTWTFVIDICMIGVSLIPLINKNYNYVERKSLMGIFAVCSIFLLVGIVIIQMLSGTFDVNNTTLLFCFFKIMFNFGVCTWCCFTTGDNKNIKTFFKTLKESYKEYKIRKIEYFLFSFLTIFIFLGGNNYIVVPICFFGIQEILKKHTLKGVLLIIIGNACLYLQTINPSIGIVVCCMYLLFALIFLCWRFFNY